MCVCVWGGEDRTLILLCVWSLKLLIKDCDSSHPIFSGYHSLRQQPVVSLAVWMDGSPEDLAAKAHSGRNHQKTL